MTKSIDDMTVAELRDALRQREHVEPKQVEPLEADLEGTPYVVVWAGDLEYYQIRHIHTGVECAGKLIDSRGSLRCAVFECEGVLIAAEKVSSEWDTNLTIEEQERYR